MKTLTVFLISLAFWNCSFAQSYDNNWVFGDSVGLNFSTDPPTFFKTEIRTHECSASISDIDGNLLFYTNGTKVWNRENEVMPNGDSLDIGQVLESIPSSLTQGVVIVPFPDSPDKFYIFYIEDFHYDTIDRSGLEYAIVDLSLNSGLGDVVEKNVEIFNKRLTEKMQAVKHANGRDWWLITRTRSESPDTTMEFLSFLLTPFGLEGPFFQDYGPGQDGFDFLGQMKFSLDGSKLAYVKFRDLYLYDFDRCSGQFSNFVSINVSDESSLYGCEFSDDMSKVYVTTAALGPTELFQYCLTCVDPIAETKSLIYKENFSTYSLYQLQRAGNGKIYVSISNDNDFIDLYSLMNQNISIIENPNEEGVGCNFDTLIVPLGEGGHTTYGLPNMPNYNLGALIGSGCDTITAISNTEVKNAGIDIYPNPATTFINISTQLADHRSVIASIYSITGIRLKEIAITSPLQKIDIGLPPGVYTVVIKNENDYIYSDKLVIIK